MERDLFGKVVHRHGRCPRDWGGDGIRVASGGAAVVITDVLDTLGEKLAGAIRESGCRAVYAHLDVTDEKAWEAVVERALAEFGGVHVLVNNAPARLARRYRAGDPGEGYERTIAVDQTGASGSHEGRHSRTGAPRAAARSSTSARSSELWVVSAARSSPRGQGRREGDDKERRAAL